MTPASPVCCHALKILALICTALRIPYGILSFRVSVPSYSSESMVARGKVSRVVKYQPDMREEVAPNRRETSTGSKPCERYAWSQQSHKEVRAEEI